MLFYHISHFDPLAKLREVIQHILPLVTITYIQHMHSNNCSSIKLVNNFSQYARKNTQVESIESSMYTIIIFDFHNFDSRITKDMDQSNTSNACREEM